jgi:hypothetical protein
VWQNNWNIVVLLGLAEQLHRRHCKKFLFDKNIGVEILWQSGMARKIGIHFITDAISISSDTEQTILF